MALSPPPIMVYLPVTESVALPPNPGTLVMPQIQPYAPVCPQCQRGMKLMLVRGAHQREFRCADCGQPDPMQSVETQAWLKGELGTVR
jgi:hypothetical protein